MKFPRYRKAVYDPMHNIWLLQKRVLFFFWFSMSTGTENEVDTAVKRLNGPEPLEGTTGLSGMSGLSGTE